jgi:hypothetical protein
MFLRIDQMKKIFSIAVVFLSMTCISFTMRSKEMSWDASTKEELKGAYEKAIAWFSNNPTCKVNIKYSSYSDHTSTKPYEESQGFYKRSNGNLHISALGITTIQNEKMYLLADTVNQLIILKNKAEFNASPVDSKSLSDLLDHVKSLKKQNAPEGEILYRLEFNPNDIYSAFEFKINTKGQFTDIIYYYSKEVKQEEDNKNSLIGKPRMEIAFSGYESNVNFNYDKEFSEKRFIKEVKGKITVNENYKKYELKDYRFAQKK